jgi:hypothetical protein
MGMADSSHTGAEQNGKCPKCGNEYIERKDYTDAGVAWDYSYTHEIDSSGTVPEVTDWCKVTGNN